MTTIVVVDGEGVQQTIPVLPNTGQATSANSLPVISAGSPYSALTPDTVIDGRPYKNVCLFCNSVASQAYNVAYSVDNQTWFTLTTFGLTAGIVLPLSGGMYYKITSGANGAFLYALA